MDNPAPLDTPIPTPPVVETTTPPSTPPSAPSRKPVLAIAAISAIVLAGIGAVVWINISGTPSQTPAPLATAPTSVPAPQPPALELLSPADGDLAVNKEILVKGKTAPNLSVALYTDSDQALVQSDREGNFESTILLADGLNTLMVTAYTESGEETSLSIDIVYDSGS